MSFENLGAVFGNVVKWLNAQLNFLPSAPRKLVAGVIVVCGLPVFVVAFLFLRAWTIKPAAHEIVGAVASAVASSVIAETNGKKNFIEESEEDGYRNGWQGWGYYVMGSRIDKNHDDDD